MPVTRLLLIALCVMAIGCGNAAKPQASKTTSGPMVVKLSGLPLTLTVKQRSTTLIQGNEVGLSLTIDDITRGQVSISIINAQGKPILGPVSMKQGDTRTFSFTGETYSLRLDELNNALVGDDFATFVISGPGAAPLSEAVKIDKLLASIEALESARFVRNGTEYTAKEAVAHLRKKLDAVKAEQPSAQQFIDRIASSSSTSGEEYEIRLSGKPPMKARDFFNEQLKAINAGK